MYVLADTNKGLTKTEITNILNQCKVELVDDGHSNNGYTYTVGLSKSKWLYNCFVKEINNKQSFENVYLFIEKAMDPVSYTSEKKRDKFDFLFEELNKVLLLSVY